MLPSPFLSRIAAGALALGLILVPAVAETGSGWAIRGYLSDACQCTVFCACEFAEKPTFGHCNDTAILHVDEGHWGEVDLSGHRIVIVSKSPDGERLVDTVGHLDFAHMYVPEQATEVQAAALADLARQVFGTWVEGKTTQISDHETVERVPMEVSIEPRRHVVRIPGILELDIEALTGWDGEDPVTLVNGPAAAEGMEPILVARSNAYRYTDHGIDWDYGGRSASIRPLDLSGDVE